MKESYPDYAVAVMVIITLLCTVWIPLGALYTLYRTKISPPTANKGPTKVKLNTIPINVYTKEGEEEEEEEEGGGNVNEGYEDDQPKWTTIGTG